MMGIFDRCYFIYVACIKTNTIMGRIGTTEIIIILVIILLLFGGKKIPELMRGLGRGMKEFKDASKGDTTDVDKTENK
jgi:sec-independent protein translocase protein TatA